MKRPEIKKYVLLAVTLFSLLSIPLLFVESLQTTFFAFLKPLWKGVASIDFPWNLKIKKIEGECEKLKIENQLLNLEVYKLKNLNAEKEVLDKSGYLLSNRVKALAAPVIYRDPACWASSFWIGVGEENNRLLKKKIVAKNSPVIVGNSILGVVESVGEKQSRVRLITDSALKPSVRAARGSVQDRVLQEKIQYLLIALNSKEPLPISLEERKEMIGRLKSLKNQLDENSKGCYLLAKGFLEGSANPLWRKKGASLKGRGFNYDYEDEESLKLSEANKKANRPVAILKVNDILVTTGMDGIFPKGLWVATVTKVFPIKEGATTYEIEAEPTCLSLDECEMVFVIPPMNFEAP